MCCSVERLSANHPTPGAGGHWGGHHSGDGSPTFTLQGKIGREIEVGDALTWEEARTIVANSNGLLRIEDGVIVGHNPDGSGDVYIVIGKKLEEGQIHDLHHTVEGSGGVGNSNGHH